MRYEDTRIQRSHCFTSGHQNRGYISLSKYFITSLFVIDSKREMYAYVYIINVPCVTCYRCGARLVSETTRNALNNVRPLELGSALNLMNNHCAIVDYQYLTLSPKELCRVSLVYNTHTDAVTAILDAHGGNYDTLF